MSFSINDLMNVMGSQGNPKMNNQETNLYNPDLPAPKFDFKDEQIEIRDKAHSAFKLSSQPRNGQLLLPRTTLHDDPRMDSFMSESAIDPNVIRKRVNPDKAMPDLKSGQNTLFSLEPDNIRGNNNVSLIQKAHKNYVSYKNRFYVSDPTDNKKAEQNNKSNVIQREKGREIQREKGREIPTRSAEDAKGLKPQVSKPHFDKVQPLEKLPAKGRFYRQL